MNLEKNHLILYSFKRCPYAMRARMALYLSNTSCEHREVSLNDKPSSMLIASSKGTVPVLILNSGEIIDESIDIVNWVLQQNNFLNQSLESSQEIYTEEKIKLFDGDFKFNLDRYKYASRYENADENEHRELCLQILRDLDRDKNESIWFFDKEVNKIDISILPFIRQFRIANIKWFDELDEIHAIKKWLSVFLQSNLLKNIMIDYEKWAPGSPRVFFPKDQ